MIFYQPISLLISIHLNQLTNMLTDSSHKQADQHVDQNFFKLADKHNVKLVDQLVDKLSNMFASDYQTC